MVEVAVSVVGAAVVLETLRRWWLRRGSDVAASGRMAVVAVAVTVLLVPALVLGGAGIRPALWWAVAVPAAWALAGVVSVFEQHEARARDASLGAPTRPLLWSPWIVAFVAFVAFLALEAVMMVWLLLWVLVTGSVGTPEITAAGGAAACGIVCLPTTQLVRRARAGGHLGALRALEGLRRRRRVAAGAGVLGAIAVACGVLWASTLTPARDDAHVVYAILASVPGWVLLCFAWVTARPEPPVSDVAPLV